MHDIRTQHPSCDAQNRPNSIKFSVSIAKSITAVPSFGYRCKLRAWLLGLRSNFSIFSQDSTWWWVRPLLKKGTLKIYQKHKSMKNLSNGVDSNGESNVWQAFICVWLCKTGQYSHMEAHPPCCTNIVPNTHLVILWGFSKFTEMFSIYKIRNYVY